MSLRRRLPDRSADRSPSSRHVQPPTSKAAREHDHTITQSEHTHAHAIHEHYLCVRATRPIPHSILTSLRLSDGPSARPGQHTRSPLAAHDHQCARHSCLAMILFIPVSRACVSPVLHLRPPPVRPARPRPSRRRRVLPLVALRRVPQQEARPSRAPPRPIVVNSAVLQQKHVRVRSRIVARVRRAAARRARRSCIRTSATQTRPRTAPATRRNDRRRSGR